MVTIQEMSEEKAKLRERKNKLVEITRQNIKWHEWVWRYASREIFGVNPRSDLTGGRSNVLVIPEYNSIQIKESKYFDKAVLLAKRYEEET